MRISHPAIKAATEVRFTAAAGGVAFPSVSTVETFTAADDTLLTSLNVNWTTPINGESNDYEVFSNRGRAATSLSARYNYHNWNVSSGPRCETACTMVIVGSHATTGPYLNLGVRLTTNVYATTDGYTVEVAVTDQSYRLMRIDNGAGTALDSEMRTFNNNDEVGIRSDGNTHTGYVNGTETLSASDSTYPDAGVSGFWPGQEDSTTLMEVDNYKTGTMA